MWEVSLPDAENSAFLGGGHRVRPFERSPSSAAPRPGRRRCRSRRGSTRCAPRAAGHGGAPSRASTTSGTGDGDRHLVRARVVDPLQVAHRLDVRIGDDLGRASASEPPAASPARAGLDHVVTTPTGAPSLHDVVEQVAVLPASCRRWRSGGRRAGPRVPTSRHHRSNIGCPATCSSTQPSSTRTGRTARPTPRFPTRGLSTRAPHARSAASSRSSGTTAAAPPRRAGPRRYGRGAASAIVTPIANDSAVL